jgi:hypothetical protein
MAITIQEKQDLINAKDWDALVKTDLFQDFNYGIHTFKQYTFDRDFILSFVFNVDHFIAHTKHVSSLYIANLYNDDVFKNIMLRCADLGIKLSTQDWKDVINAINILYSNKIIDGCACANVLDITGKDVDYFRVLLDAKIVAKLLLIRLQGFTANRLNAEEFTKLTPEEQRIVSQLLTYNNNARIHIDNGDERIFANVTKDYKDLNNISRMLMLKVSSILADLGPDEYIKILLDLIYKGEVVAVESWLPYFLEHPDYEIDDEQFRRLFNKFGGHMFMYMINNVSEKAIEEKIKSIHTGYLVTRQSMSLERISELLGHAKTDLSGSSRFFTEEEIAQHPHFFDPRVLIRRTNHYVSRDTFKILNKSWGTIQQYNDDLVDFVTIVRSLTSDALSIKTLRYLKEKTNASNEVVTSTILGRHIDGDMNKDAKKLSIVKNFIKKFDQ